MEDFFRSQNRKSKTRIIYGEDGYDKQGYDSRGFDRNGINKITGNIYDERGYDQEGYNREGYNKRNFNRNGIHKFTGTIYDGKGIDVDGYNQRGIDTKRFDRNGIHETTGTRYNPKGYDVDGFREDGYNDEGYDREGFDRNGFNKSGLDRDGFYKDGYDKEGFDRDGFNKQGYNRNNLDRRGFDKNHVHKDTGTIYDIEGYDSKGFNKEGYNRDGMNKNGHTKEELEETRKAQRSVYLGLINKATKLASGELSVEQYIKTSKLSMDELIEFAKKIRMDSEIVRELYKKIPEYKKYTKPFFKKQYLESTIIIINGEEVKPTEQDVDICVNYLKSNDIMVCKTNVADTVRAYLRGELEIKIFTPNEIGKSVLTGEKAVDGTMMQEGEEKVAKDIAEITKEGENEKE